jgi:transposase-like protein
MNGRRDVRLEARWRGLVEEYLAGRVAGGGLGVREFCRRHKITESSFYFWRQELERRDRERNDATPQHQPAWKERLRIPPSAKEADVPASTRAAFVPVRVAQETRSVMHGGIVITLSGGVRVHVTAPVDRQALVDVLAVLEARFSFAKARENA